MKKILIFVFGLLFVLQSFATGINVNAASADCDNATLGQYNGTANLEMDWQPNTINIRWYDGENQLSVPTNAQTCSYGGALYLPTPPTKKGYTFEGWKVTVPTGYTELEYIELTGTQYIDTGIVLTDATNIEQTFWIQLNSNHFSDFQTFFGFKKSSDVPRYGVHAYARSWMMGTNRTSIADVLVDGSVHQLTFTSTQNTQTLKDSDGTTIISTAFDIRNSLNYNVLSGYFGARNNGNSETVNYVYGKMGRSYLKQNGILLYNYIPVRHNSDNVLGMYDTVTGTFFTNAGTGTFIAGPVAQ